ncbi:MAG: response regulator transcription factor [Acidobacteria bacterium]|nr:response regulator transcription factor [Acidobacteriota bacterium]
MTCIRILLADDHAVLRAGLRALLDAEPDLEVVAEAGDGLECIEKVLKLSPDVVLLDINMPRCNGLVTLQRIQEEAPDSRVLVLTMHDDVEYLRSVLASGGSGFILKQAASDELLSAIRTVHQGGVYLHPEHARLLAGEAPDQRTSAAPAPLDEKQARFQSLSDRESEVFKLVVLGYRNAEIAAMVFLSVKTVETYKARLMRKLEVRSRAALVRYALELGILT